MPDTCRRGALAALVREPVLLLGAVIALGAPTPCPADEAFPEAARVFLGTWEHVGGDAEEQARLDAIDAVAEEMPAFARAIVRNKLRSGPVIRPAFVLAADGAQLSIGEPGGELATAPLDGTTTEVVLGGETLQVTRQLVDGALRSHAVLPQGWSISTYRLSQDGQTLTLVRETGSDRLPRSLVFEATYRRQ